jgi:hypothetical protein
MSDKCIKSQNRMVRALATPTGYTMAKFGPVHNLVHPPGTFAPGPFLPFPHSSNCFTATRGRHANNTGTTRRHVRILNIAVRSSRHATAAEAQSSTCRIGWNHYRSLSEEEGFQSLSMLSSAESQVQCHRARCSVYELQVGRG